MVQGAARLAVLLLATLEAACWFKSSHPDWGVGGHVRLADGTPLAGVSVSITWPDFPGQQRTETTDLDGHYFWSWSATWGAPIAVEHHVAVRPSLVGYAFTPAVRDLKLDGVQDDLDFSAAPLATAAPTQIWLWVAWSPVATGNDRVEIGAVQVYVSR
jgi:hypothetical protein